MENSVLRDIEALETKMRARINQLKGADEEESKEEGLIRKRLK